MTLEAMIHALIDREGGYVNHPNDPGGATNFGITERVARANGYTGSMQAMTRAQAAAIYQSAYWYRPGFDDVAGVYPKVAEELFDTGVNMGLGKASEFLQICLNAFNEGGTAYPDVAEDGDIGPATIKALRAFKEKRRAEGEAVMVKALNCLQGARYIDLSRANKKLESFTYGWLRTRVA